MADFVGARSDDVHHDTHSDPPGMPDSMQDYHFPDFRLKRKMDDPEKTPLLLVACGSFSPITYLHLRMFEMAADYVKFSTDFELIGGYLSPVSDSYRKAGLASAEDRYVTTRGDHYVVVGKSNLVCAESPCAN